MTEGLSLEIRTFGGRVTTRKLERMEGRARRPRAAFEEAYKRFRELESIQFGREGGGPSGPWASLKDNTIEKKIHLGQDPRILHATFGLRNSLTKRGAKGAVFRTQGDTAVFGTSIRYSGFHQKGTRRMVARPPVDLREQDKREMVEMIEEWIMR